MAGETKRLRWGDKRVAWDENLAHGRVLPDFDSDTTLGALTISAEYPSDPPIYAWTGAGDLVLDGITYTGMGPDVMEVSIGQASEKEDARLQVKLTGLVTPELRDSFYEFKGRVIVTVQFVYSNDGGETWLTVPRRYRGLYSRPVFVADALSFEVATYREELDRGYEQVFSDKSQQAETLGDLFFSHLTRIAEGAELMTRWPP